MTDPGFDLWSGEEPRLHLAWWDGDGPPVLLLHGMGAHTHWWDSVAPRLAERCRPVALDLRGHGESGWRPDGKYGPAKFVEDVEDARHLQGWDKFLLVGHSLGARVALDYAAAYPDRLTGVVALDFLAEPGGGRFSKPRTIPQPYYETQDAALQRFRLQPDGTTLSPEQLRELGKLSVRKTERGWTWKYDWRCFHYSYDPIWDVLPKIRVPALIARGELSTLMPQETLARVTGSIAGARSAVIPGAHHHVCLDNPEATAEVLLSAADFALR